MPSAMRTHYVRGTPTPISSSEIAIASGNLKFPVLCTQISSEDPLIRTKALAKLSGGLIALKGDAVLAVEAGIVSRLLALLDEPDATMRGYALSSLTQCTTVGIGRDALLRDDVFPSLMRPALLNDPSVEARRSLMATMAALCKSTLDAAYVVESGAVGVLIAFALDEPDELARSRAIDAVANCTRLPSNEGVVAAVAEGAMELCVEVLREGGGGIVLCAARLLERLTHWTDGKQRALDCRCLDAVCANLQHAMPEVRAECARTLANVTVPTRGKLALVSECTEEFVEPLVLLLGLAQPADVQLAAVAAISTIAAHPKVRKALNVGGAIDALQLCMEDDEPLLQDAARAAIKALQWQP